MEAAKEPVNPTEDDEVEEDSQFDDHQTDEEELFIIDDLDEAIDEFSEDLQEPPEVMEELPEDEATLGDIPDDPDTEAEFDDEFTGAPDEL